MAASKKEALLLCLDVGSGMIDSTNNQSTSLDLCIHVISTLVQRKIFSQSKDEVSLVLFGTNETSNPLNQEDEESYQNILIAFSLGCPNFELLHYLSNDLKPGVLETDFVDALTVSLDHLHKETRYKKISSSRIVLFTNFCHPTSDENLDGIIDGFNTDGMNVQLDVISSFTINKSLPNDDDTSSHGDDQPSTSTHRRSVHGELPCGEKPKLANQQAGEGIITRMHGGGVHGDCYTLREAVKAVMGFEKCSVRSAKWKCNLTLGSHLSIPCCAYIKTKEAKLKQTWKKCHAKTHKKEDITSNMFYYIDDDEKTEVTKENLGKGYKYGKDIITFGTEDEKQMKFAARDKCLSILGFTDMRNIHVIHHMDDQAHVVIPETGDDHAGTALSALCMAMVKQNLCAVACHVYRKGSNPKLVALLPKVKLGSHYLVMVSLPFAEDIRPLSFESLFSGKNKQPSEDQLQLADDLISSMDFTQSEDGIFKAKEKMNPTFQRTFQCLDHRLKHPDGKLPELNQLIRDSISISHPASVETLLDQIHEKFPVILNKKPQTSHEAWINNKSDVGDPDKGDKPDVSVSAHIRNEQTTSIGTVTTDQDFVEVLQNGSLSCNEAFDQMEQRIKEFVSDSFVEVLKYKILKCLMTLMEQTNKMNATDRSKRFMNELKQIVLATNPTLWNFLKENGIQDDSDSSDDKMMTSDYVIDDEADALLDMME
ncbi:zinc finger protein ZF(C2H2)-102 [Ciona intestinalis]